MLTQIGDPVVLLLVKGEYKVLAVEGLTDALVVTLVVKDPLLTPPLLGLLVGMEILQKLVESGVDVNAVRGGHLEHGLLMGEGQPFQP